MRHRAKFCANRSKHFRDMDVFSIFEAGGRPPSWICSTPAWTTHKLQLVVFIVVQNLVGIESFNVMRVYRLAFKYTDGGRISVKFSVNVNGWPRYQTAKKNCRKFQPAEQGAPTLQTDARRTTDGTAIAYSEPEHKFTFAKNVGFWPANFPCPPLDLQRTGNHLCG